MADADERADQAGARATDKGAGPASPRSVPRPGAEPITMAKRVGDLGWSRVIFVAGISAIFASLGTLTIGSIGDAKGYQLLKAIEPTTRTVCFTAIGASATIMALMMTGLSIGKGWSRNFRPEHYDRIRQISLLSTLTIILAIFLLLFFNVPIKESEAFDTWYATIYYAVSIWSSIIGGMLIATVFLLYNAIVVLILAVDPHTDASDVLEGAAVQDKPSD